MSGIGFDAGTYNLICAKRGKEENKIDYQREVNAFLEISLDDPFTFNMMHKAKVPLIVRDKVSYLVGEAAMKTAFSLKKLEIRRPMRAGCLNSDERDAFSILKVMIHSLIGEVENDGDVVFYSVPANAVNQHTDADYHSKVLEEIFKKYHVNGKTIKPFPINEGQALVFAELQDKNFTGVGISCLCPGTLVYTDKGIVPIESVRENDMVLTHRGRWRPVTKVIPKKFFGKATTIKVAGSNSVQKFVEDHELYVYRDGDWRWVGCDTIKRGDIMGEPIERMRPDLTVPVISYERRTTNSKNRLRKNVEVGPDVARLLGYFLADGSVNNKENCIQIDFGRHEEQNIQDAEDILRSIFQKNSSRTDHGPNCIRIKCYDAGLSRWFRSNVYDENKKKRFPWGLDRLTNDSVRSLLVGLIRGDGNTSDTSVVFTNTNRRLALLAKQAFARIGIAASLFSRNTRSHRLMEGREIKGKSTEWSVHSSARDLRCCLKDDINAMGCHNSGTAKKTFVMDGFSCGKVREVSNEDYEGLVYDLQVEEDHSFSGPGMTIHNCGAGMLNFSYCVFSRNIFSFATTISGDWIDAQAAHSANESVVAINRIKQTIDLTKRPTNAVERAINTQYRIMIEKNVRLIKQALEQNSGEVRADDAVDIVLGGGTCSPPGFEEMFAEAIKAANLPIPVGDIKKPADHLYCVARGCLVAAENV